MFQIISGTSKKVSGTQNLERNVPNTAHKTVPDISLLLGTLYLLAFPVANDDTRDRVLPGPEICSPQSSGRSLPSHCDGTLLHGRGVGQLSDGRAKKRVRGSGKNNLSASPSSSSDNTLCRTVVASNEPKLQTKDGLFDFFNGGFEDGLFTANLFVQPPLWFSTPVESIDKILLYFANNFPK